MCPFVDYGPTAVTDEKEKARFISTIEKNLDRTEIIEMTEKTNGKSEEVMTV